MKTLLLSIVLITFLISSAGSEPCPLGDLSRDCKVDLEDLTLFAEQWLDDECSGPNCANLDNVGRVNMADFALLADNWLADSRGITLVINEFMANNDSFIQDPQGDYDDWIEIYNFSDQAINIGGMYLTDDLSTPTKWRIPNNDPSLTTIAPHSYLLIWADGQTNQGTLHANFRLSTDGEQIGLYDTDENLIDSVTFGQQNTDQSFGRFPDGSNNWQTFTTPTPRSSNQNELITVLISEIMYHPYSEEGIRPEDIRQEYIELFNAGNQSVDLSGWRFSDGVDFSFPNNVTIDAGQYLVVAADVNTFMDKYPVVTNVVGQWNGRLNNKGEMIELVNNMGVIIGKLYYADQGDWTVRQLGPEDYYHRGWVWSDEHDGGGKSLELINPAMPNEYGQNWAASDVNNGTPGMTNSVANDNIAPLILDVKHLPTIPGPNDLVTVLARIIDELQTDVTVTLHYRVDASVYEAEDVYPHHDPNDYNHVAMFDDGAHGDGNANDGVYGAQIPTQNNGTIIEFYVQASDAEANSRTWPAPSIIDGNFEQVTNALYQVDASFDPDAVWVPGSQPIYYLIMTEAERARLADIGYEQAGDNDERYSHAQMNGTFISIDGVDMKLRYNVGIRNRGEGTSGRPPNNYRVNFRHDDSWKDVTAININSKYTYLQLAGSAIFRMAGLPAAQATAVQVRVNGQNLAETGQRMYGSYVCLEVYNSDWAERHIPDDSDGNMYEASHWPWTADLSYLGTDPADYVEAGYYKLTNEAQYDWTDLFDLTSVLDNEPNATYAQHINRVLNVRQWLRWFALNSLLGNNENGLANGVGDDYRMYRGIQDSRFILLIHDLDTIFHVAHEIPSMNRTIFYPADRGYLPVLARFLKHPEFVSEYFAQFMDLIETVLSPEQLSPLLEQLLGDWVPPLMIDEMKNKTAERIANVVQQIPLTFSIRSELPTISGFHYTGTSLACLSGTANAIETRSVLVNGQLADWSPLDGVWSIGETIALNPGINRIIVETFDEPNGAGNKLEHGFIDIYYADGDVSEFSTLTTDTTLDAMSGPWHVIGDVVVPAGVTLMIEPGTTLFFDSGTGITVNGRLVADGTQYQRIRLTRLPGTGSSWKGLTFNNSMQSNHLCYVDMEFGDGQGESINISYSKVLIDNVTWAGTNSTVLDMRHPSVTVWNSFIPGVSAEPIHGMYMEADEYLVFENNIFGAGTGSGDIIDWDTTDDGKPYLILINNIFLGGGDDGADVDGTDAYLEGNLFMNFHCSDPATTSNAVTGGYAYSGASNRPDVTLVRNIFIDVDHALLIKGEAYATIINNVFANSADAPIQFWEPQGRNPHGPAKGAYIDGNIFYKYDNLFNHQFPQEEPDQPEYPDPNIIINRSIIPAEFHYLGQGNIDADPIFVDPNNDFRLKPMSPAIGTGPRGLDMGAYVPSGAAICGEPDEITYHTDATLTIGGPGITHYKWSLNDPNGPWSQEQPVNVPIELSSLANGYSYTVYVMGKNAAGIWQNEPRASRTWTVDTSYWRLIINEILARNLGVVDHEGTLPDLIELYYDGPSSISLSGMSISDDPADNTKFIFPAGTTMHPGEFLVLYADSNTATSGIHLGFELDGDGDAVYLHDKDGVMLDSVEFGLQLANLSIGRLADGRWCITIPTFGQDNIAQPLGNPAKLKINEWLAKGDVLFENDFIELFNPNACPVDLGGLYLTDNPVTQPSKHKIHPLTFIAAESFTVFAADDQNLPGHLSFKLSIDGEMIGLFDNEPKEIDKVIFGPQMSDVSQGRTPDGSDKLEFFELPTPGAANPAETIIITVKNLIPIDAVWSYDQTNIAPPVEWHNPNYDDSLWPSGQALLYVEDSALPAPKNTELTLGPKTFYFRRHFTFDGNPSNVTQLDFYTVIDDGAVFYLNGQEVLRMRLGGDVTYDTWADPYVKDAVYEYFSVPANHLEQGDNVIAAEVHQSSSGSSDIVFGLKLDAIVTTSDDTEPSP